MVPIAALLPVLLLITAHCNADSVSAEDGYRPPYQTTGIDDADAFVPPKISEEMELSGVMPAYLRCDGCRAIATQFHLVFVWAHGRGKRAKSRTMGETELSHVAGRQSMKRFCAGRQ